ncbi:MBOAT family protein [Desulfovibrio sulfodismutans]|uniref:MBOAT family protein n=1 Tax=Desulfolutivibrio sulfodismutans TaxID=63561 RepID=A0A7K3NHY7_9BACT|nr:MBOAT family protein [Desulfolutivibrio sulfodismutans]NDY55395.1 MBOAT family protein [Desulfolutivibrio sulfodismutans]QLA12230.1 MBOAT family protein [Desulfolutivibrio sulfodismutans DSM 3696]
MSLDSPLFLFVFLPAVLAGFFVAPTRFRPHVLLAASLIFTAMGDVSALPVLAVSILGNHALALAIGNARDAGRTVRRKRLTALGVAANIGYLAKAKYLAFVVSALPFLESSGIDPANIHGLPPLGISFFTFQAVSYLVDVSRGQVAAEKNLLRTALYLSFFPKMIAGPIARYAAMLPGMRLPRPALSDVAAGSVRFCLGLAKKTLLAGTLGPVADAAFSARPLGGALDMGTAWLGLLAYTGQIYFDFSGYTDMAVGLGRMFGIALPENFDHPYVSRSVREFWRRWHISLSTWFRDYLYIPLGGGRVSPVRVQGNLLTVFVLCGLWHGASWTFVVWGLFHGVFLVLERTRFGRAMDAAPAALGHAYALLAVMLGWVFFRAADLPQAVNYLGALFSFRFEGFAYTWMTAASRQALCALVLAVVFSLPLGGAARTVSGLAGRCGTLGRGAAAAAAILAPAALLVLSAMQLAAGTYSPFIYARF